MSLLALVALAVWTAQAPNVPCEDTPPPPDFVGPPLPECPPPAALLDELELLKSLELIETMELFGE